MKKLMFLFLLLLSLGYAYGQSAENKGKEIPVVEKAEPSGTKKGISISSAARRRSLVNKKLGKTFEESSDKSKSNTGSEISEKVRRNMPSEIRKASGAGRPSNTVPAARPMPPVVRPNVPRPNTPTPAPKGKPQLPGKPGGM